MLHRYLYEQQYNSSEILEMIKHVILPCVVPMNDFFSKLSLTLWNSRPRVLYSHGGPTANVILFITFLSR